MEEKKKALGKLFTGLGQEVFTLADMKRILDKAKFLLALPAAIKVKELVSFLEKFGVISSNEIVMPDGKKVKRFRTERATAYELALSLKKNSYLSHYSAVFLHGLTDNVPKTIYTNTELHRGGKSNSGRLEQGNIDRAFSCNMRQSNQVARYDDIEIYLLNSKNVGRIGVKDFDLNGVKLRVTDIERTLIDITVRPNYSGGIYEVLHAYEAAKDRVSVNRLMATLKKLDYTYPYHQAIGFYMEQAGYSESVLKLVEKMEIKYDFYLTYKMKEPEYSERWKLYYPRGFEILS
jgi:predicted transcriptional regulator of viral defense system